ncbi:alpha/beta-hydrolase [Hypoxylon crocopeplum]|nr:alpha/beta-hydrolase [Hypoxylon crocopeplum]
MRFLYPLTTAVGVAGLLVTPNLAPSNQHQPLILPNVGGPIYSDSQQKPLLLKTGSKYSVREQTKDICDAGSRQWTGWAHVSDEKSLFFWFFESRNDPLNDPVMIWMNGGPGGSSMMGLFSEIGPCLANGDGNSTYLNEHSWTNFANVIFLDQPAGVGFSMMNNSTMGGPDNELEASRDFDKFLSIFFSEAFPNFSHLPLHITGESFGGTYVPGFVDYISRRQQLGVPGIYGNRIHSITLVDAVIELLGSGSLGQYDHMCRFNKHGENKLRLGYNQSTCGEIEKAVPECERLNRQCVESYDGNICRAAFDFCIEKIESFVNPQLGGRYPYDDRVICNGTLPLCGMDWYDEYLNSVHVQKALGLDRWNFSSINWDLNSRWDVSNEMFIPTTRELAYILDETPTRVLVLNGNNDIIVNTEGQKRVYDQQSWGHQAKYRMETFADWSWPDKSGKLSKGGEFKAVDKLAFVSVDEAGHTSPGDQREAVAFLMKCWLRVGEDAACPI